MAISLSRKPKTVYLSHTFADKMYATQLEEYLANAGFRTSRTPHIKNAMRRQEHARHLVEQADAVVCVTSPSSTREAQIWHDTTIAHLNDKPVVPVVIHHFTERVPMKGYINAVDNMDEGCARLHDALMKKRNYANNQINGEIIPLVRAAALAAVIAVVIIGGLMYMVF